MRQLGTAVVSLLVTLLFVLLAQAFVLGVEAAVVYCFVLGAVHYRGSLRSGRT